MLNVLPSSIFYEVINQRSLRVENDDSLDAFISEGTETNGEMLYILYFVTFQSCSTDVINALSECLGTFLRNQCSGVGQSSRPACPFSNSMEIVPFVGEEGSEFDVPNDVIAHTYSLAGQAESQRIGERLSAAQSICHQTVLFVTIRNYEPFEQLFDSVSSELLDMSNGESFGFMSPPLAKSKSCVEPAFRI
jgi:hypothetical protein